ncbi:MAG: ROK family protein [Mycobacteriales bacterium]
MYAGERTEAGILFDGQIMRGTHGSAGQLGHLPVLAEGIGPNLLYRGCGTEGSLQAVLHPQRLIEEFRTAQSHYRPTPHLAGIQDLAAAARAGNPAAAGGMLADAGRVLGTAIAAIVLVLDPPRVLLGGALAAAGELVLAPAQAVVDAHRPQHRDGTTALDLGALGDHAAATGALAAGVLGGPGRDDEREKVR